MTLNQVVNRIKDLSLAHKQVRTFYAGLETDFLTDKTTKYPGVFMLDNGGSISLTGHATTLTYKLFFLDLVHVSEDAKQNEQDVQSDMVSVAMDILAEMNSGIFDDWAISSDNTLQLMREQDNDLIAGCTVDVSIRIKFEQNVCQVPTELINGSPIDTDMKLVYDEIYAATGTEGSTLTIPALKGKRILFITRENGPIYKVSNSPGSTEYTWDNTDIGLGTPVIANQRFLILYRNY